MSPRTKFLRTGTAEQKRGCLFFADSPLYYSAAVGVSEIGNVASRQQQQGRSHCRHMKKAFHRPGSYHSQGANGLPV